MKILVSIIIAIHALIHLFGFSKAFGIYNFKEITADISRPMGLLWLTSAILIILGLILFTMNTNYRWVIGFVALTSTEKSYLDA